MTPEMEAKITAMYEGSAEMKELVDEHGMVGLFDLLREWGSKRAVVASYKDLLAVGSATVSNWPAIDRARIPAEMAGQIHAHIMAKLAAHDVTGLFAALLAYALATRGK